MPHTETGTMQKARRLEMPAPGTKNPRHVPLGDWVFDEPSELAARRHQVWGLLGWYHMTQVLPNRGLKGFFRRLWLRLTGREAKILSPWEALARRAREEALKAQAQQEEAGPATDPAPSPAAGD